MPEDAPYGNSADHWEAVQASVFNSTGLLPSLNTLRNKVRALRKDYNKYKNLTHKSGQDVAEQKVMESFREYEEHLEARKVGILNVLFVFSSSSIPLLETVRPRKRATS